MGSEASPGKIAPRHRRNLPRKRKNLRLELRWSVYEMLAAMKEDGQPLVEVIENIILTAGCPKRKNDHVHEPLRRLKSVA
jgi:hypothetical protein